VTLLATAFFSQATVRFVLIGLATGALYAIVALGVVLTYRASGVLNFATGSLGAIAAFLFYSLRDNHGVPWVLALIIALVVGAAIGAITQFLVMTLLRRVSVLGKLIATLGLMTVGQGLINVIWKPTMVTQPNSILPTKLVKITSQIVIPEDRLFLLGGALIAAAILRVVYTRTTFGLATSAVAENRRVAAASGWSPTVVELVNFVVAGVLSAAAAILLAPIVGLDPTVLTLVVLPSLAAALVGRFSSFTITVLAALLIGIATAELSLFQSSIASVVGLSQSSLGDLPDVVPLLIIIIATAMSGRARLQRGDVLSRLPLPGSGRVPVARLLLASAVGLVLVFVLSANWQVSLLTTFAWAIIVLSVVVVTGYCGQLSLCQYALAGFGAWVAARLASTQGFPFEAALAVGVVLTIPVGLLVALPALRTRGVNLAVATLGLAEMISAIVFNNGSLTGGFIGTTVSAPHFFGLNLDPIAYPARYAAFALVAFVLCGLIVANVRRGRAGRRMLAVRANERAAASLGVGVYGAKLFAFGLSSAIAALGGILLAFENPNVQFTSFDVFGSINAVLYAVVGGAGWAAGALVGAVQVAGAAANTLINDIVNFNQLPNWLLVFSGVAVVVILRSAPDGLAALASAQWRALAARLPAPPRRWRTDAAPRREVRESRPPAALSVQGLTVRFGGVVALNDVSFAVAPGEIVGLIGPNGAGKTTLLDVVTGFTRQSEGTVCLDGEAVERRSAERRARDGMARSWQVIELFEEMTVRENLLVAADRQDPRRYLTDLLRPGRPTTTDLLEEIVGEFELTEHLDDRPSKLPQGTARLVGIARAIVTEPRILLLDEPAAGLDAHESAELGRAIRGVSKRSGIGILIVEHDVNLLMSICDRIVVLDFGRKIAEGTPQEVSRDQAVIAAYLGAAPPGASEPAPVGEAVLPS
jgi:sulfate-transporting ATPase